MLSGILNRYGLQPDQIAMVGDRIYTDIEMAHNAAAMGVLVLSGETTLDVADKADKQPHIICDNIGVLGGVDRRGAFVITKRLRRTSPGARYGGRTKRR